jgi:hypothetical protein
LQGANLQGADLQDADLEDADLRYANLQGANLEDADLRYANLRDANLQGADLQGADLRDADLRYANLQGANLQGADLRDANLQDANLQGADLQGADLRDANLRGATGYNKYAIQPLLMLQHQSGKIAAFKMVSPNGKSPIADEQIQYEIGKTYKVTNADTDEHRLCGAGLHAATLPWINQNWSKGNRLLEVQFTAKDIAAIPLTSDGKFRVHKLKVVQELNPADFGLS